LIAVRDKQINKGAHVWRLSNQARLSRLRTAYDKISSNQPYSFLFLRFALDVSASLLLAAVCALLENKQTCCCCCRPANSRVLPLAGLARVFRKEIWKKSRSQIFDTASA